MNKDVDACGACAEEFAADDGRRPRILVAKMGQDGHDRGQKVIATAFADLGFDVDIGPLFQRPTRRRARRWRTTCTSSARLAGGRPPDAGAAPDGALAKLGRDDIMIVVGGVIPPDDYPRPVRGRRQGRVRPRHQHPCSGGGPARQTQQAAGLWAAGGGGVRGPGALNTFLPVQKGGVFSIED